MGKSSSNEESPSTATMKTAADEDDLFAPETEIVFEPVESTAETLAVESADDFATDTSVVDNELDSKRDDENPNAEKKFHPNFDEVVRTKEPVEKEDSSFDILDSEEMEEDHHSWENVNGNEDDDLSD